MAFGLTIRHNPTYTHLDRRHVTACSPIAEIDTSGLAGSSGWLGCGLLGVMMGWLLLKHLPDVLNDHRQDRATRDAIIQKLVDTHAAEIAKVTDNFRAELRQERDICERRDRDLIGVIERNQNTLASSLTEINRAIELNNQMVEQWMRFSEGSFSAGPKPKSS
jgi:hypothetical protein